MIRKLISSIFRPEIISPLPKGIVADPVGGNGLFGFWSASNANSESLSSTATAGTNVNIPVASVVAGVVQLNTGASGTFTATLPSTSAIIAALGPIPLDASFQKPMSFINNSGQAGTLTAGDANTTIVGTALLGSTYNRTYMMQVLGSANISLSNMGYLPL